MALSDYLLQINLGVQGETQGGLHKCAPRSQMFFSQASSYSSRRAGALLKVLPVPGWQSMKQLALCVHFLRCGGLLDDWSLEGNLSLFFIGIHRIQM
ncbi:UNVERIFIED_CONTAM: hypothetical protein NCL1_46977 [Trichonephila clavipes]